MDRVGALPGVPRREAVRDSAELALADFLALPERTSKPRSRGVTHVIDRGLPIATLESLVVNLRTIRRSNHPQEAKVRMAEMLRLGAEIVEILQRRLERSEAESRRPRQNS